MVRTKKEWCDICKQMTYGCQHEENKLPVDLPPQELEKLIQSHSTVPLRPPRFMTSWVLFEADYVASGAIQVLTVQPQVAFKPERLVVDPLIAPYFTLMGIRVGNCAQESHPWSHGAGCTIFTPHPDDLAPLNNLDGISVVSVAMNFSLLIRNRTSGPFSFNALVWGKTIW